MWYKAEYEDDRFEMILADSDEEAFQQAYDNEDEFGTLFNVFALDENDNEIKTVFQGSRNDRPFFLSDIL